MMYLQNIFPRWVKNTVHNLMNTSFKLKVANKATVR